MRNNCILHIICYTLYTIDHFNLQRDIIYIGVTSCAVTIQTKYKESVVQK